MRLPRTLGTLGLASVVALAAGLGAMAHGTGPANAQGNPSMAGCPHAGMGYGMMGRGMMGQGMGPGMGGQGMGQGMGRGMGPGMMGRGMGPGMMGPGMMGPGMMGPGMMGQGKMGQGMMQALPEDLTPAQVRHMFEHRLAWHGNPNVKVAEVAEADEDTITLEIVTRDGSLVQRFDVDRHTGAFRPAR